MSFPGLTNNTCPRRLDSCPSFVWFNLYHCPRIFGHYSRPVNPRRYSFLCLKGLVLVLVLEDFVLVSVVAVLTLVSKSRSLSLALYGLVFIIVIEEFGHYSRPRSSIALSLSLSRRFGPCPVIVIVLVGTRTYRFLYL